MREALPLFFILIAFFSGLFIGGGVVNKAFKNDLLEQDHAYYHPQTGNFTLKECKE